MTDDDADETMDAAIKRVDSIVRERDAALARVAALEAYLKQAHDENWTPTGLDKLNTFARSELLPEMRRPEELPGQIDAIVFHFMAKTSKAEARVAALEAELKALEARQATSFGAIAELTGKSMQLRARVAALKILCARAASELDEHHLDHTYLGDDVLREELRAAGRGEAVLPRGLVKGPSGDLTEAEVKEILAAPPPPGAGEGEMA